MGREALPRLARRTTNHLRSARQTRQHLRLGTRPIRPPMPPLPHQQTTQTTRSQPCAHPTLANRPRQPRPLDLPHLPPRMDHHRHPRRTSRQRTRFAGRTARAHAPISSRTPPRHRPSPHPRLDHTRTPNRGGWHGIPRRHARPSHATTPRRVIPLRTDPGAKHTRIPEAPAEWSGLPCITGTGGSPHGAIPMDTIRQTLATTQQLAATPRTHPQPSRRTMRSTPPRRYTMHRTRHRLRPHPTRRQPPTIQPPVAMRLAPQNENSNRSTHRNASTT